MTQPLVRAVFGLVVGFLTFNLSARALGSTQLPHPALRGFTEGCQDKPQPCWHGIMPGQTTLEAGRSALLQAGWRAESGSTIRAEFRSDDLIPGCIVVYFHPQTRFIRMLSLSCWRQVTVGDALADLGQPDYIVYDLLFSRISKLLCYGACGRLSGLNIEIRNFARLSAYREVISIGLYPNRQAEDDPPLAKIAWHGFAPRWWHCRTKRISYLC